ncbi:AMP-binding protein [Yinghuangia aomiensis]
MLPRNQRDRRTGRPAGDRGSNTRPTCSDHATAERLLSRLVRVLERVAAAWTSGSARYDLLTTDEHRQVVAEWNATAHDLPNVTVAELLEERAAAEPDAVALVFRPGTPAAVVWTYRDLNARANRISAALACGGAGPERVVALGLPRTPDMVAGPVRRPEDQARRTFRWNSTCPPTASRC